MKDVVPSILNQKAKIIEDVLTEVANQLHITPLALANRITRVYEPIKNKESYILDNDISDGLTVLIIKFDRAGFLVQAPKDILQKLYGIKDLKPQPSAVNFFAHGLSL